LVCFVTYHSKPGALSWLFILHNYMDLTYPPFIKDAEEEEAKAARAIFHLANEAEKVHEKLFLKAAEAVEKNQDVAAESFYLCPVCGYVCENEAPEKCPICGAPGSNFKKY